MERCMRGTNVPISRHDDMATQYWENLFKHDVDNYAKLLEGPHQAAARRGHWPGPLCCRVGVALSDSLHDTHSVRTGTHI